MTQTNNWTQPYLDWHANSALPLWTGPGVDSATGTVWEALDHEGQPLEQMNRRQRVQFRQAYVFAQSPVVAHRDLGWQLFRRTMDHGFDPETGRFATWVDATLAPLDQTHGLYDLAFGLLAASALGQAGRDVASDIERLEQALSLLTAPLGWYESPEQHNKRTQNSHMHMFEASTALYALTGDARHRAMAQTSLEICASHVVQDNGTMLEFFATDWTPLTGEEQAIEPGHMAEWIYLADCYDKVMGTSSGLPLDSIWQATLDHRLPSGFLPDVAGGQIRRLWPQTELLKAAVVMDPTGPLPQEIASLLWQHYMATPAAGGWFDQFQEDGRLLSQNMPASTFYHVEMAVAALRGL